MDSKIVLRPNDYASVPVPERADAGIHAQSMGCLPWIPHPMELWT